MSKIIYPKALEDGGNIGTVAMSCGAVDEYGILKVKSSIENFKDRGFNIVETASIYKCEKFVSAPGDIRAKEFFELWENKDVTYILVLRGGEFLMETLEHLNKERILKYEPKWVQGYSDVSLLNFYLTTNFNFATIHSNGFTGFAMKPWDETLELPIEIVKGKKEYVQKNFEMFQAKSDRTVENACAPYNCTEPVVYKNLFGNDDVKISGRLIGGCMDVIKLLIGTEFDNTKEFCKQFEEGMLWYLENCELSVLEMKRVLWQMKKAGWFENANGFIIGRTNSKEQAWDFTYEDALIDTLKELNVPVIYDVDFGHTDPQWTMVNGASAEFIYHDGKGEITQYLN